jgi:glycosyltransferase involved in cell wall biosynthesis
LNIPCRHIHNGIPLVPFPPEYEPNSLKGEYLLSLNRITDEKGIHDAIDVALSTNTPIVIVGDDTKVVSQHYVNQIIERCRHSNGLAQYLGLVDTNTKNHLIKGCKALISCPKPTWMEAFGLYAIEAMAYYKPVLALANGGLNDIIVNGINGFLAPNTEQLKKFVYQLDKIDPKNCRNVVEQNFTKEIMAAKYLDMFQKILDKDNSMLW